MKKLIEVAHEITAQGAASIKKYGPSGFPGAATEILQNARMPDYFDYQELVELSMAEEFNRLQNFNSFEFSDLPITLSRDEGCFLDIYFWRRRPTVIHNHHFSGAFQCLQGVNVDLEFEFSPEKGLGKHHTLGTLNLINSRKLLKGDVATIGFLDSFIHQNHHQADLTINLCLRTPEVKGSSISNYLYSGLRYNKDKILLSRVHRLLRFIGLEAFDHRKVDISIDDAINFLIQTFETRSQNPRLQELIRLQQQRISQELGIDLLDLLRRHDAELARIEETYD